MSAIRFMLANKCPHCHKGQVFKSSNLISLRIGKMNESCPCCHMDFNQEPGFYWGAMYVSYGLALLQVAITGTLLFFFSMQFDFWSLGIIVAVLLLLAPFNYRISRLAWLYMFAKMPKTYG